MPSVGSPISLLHNGRMVRPTQTLPERPLLESSPPAPWQHEAPVALTHNVRRLTAPNPGFMTGPGTNTYLVGEAATGYVVIDPGPADEAHVRRIWQACAHVDHTGGNIVAIVCTHSHADHAPGAWLLQTLCVQQPPVLGLPSAPTARPAHVFTPNRTLQNQERMTLISRGLEADLAQCHTLRVLYTPGHAANHVCLLLEEDRILFSGDHILNGSTTVVDPPDGNMTDYLDSLDLLHATVQAHAVEYILPAHGHVLGCSHEAALGVITHLKAHRLKREAKIAAVVAAHPHGTVDDWLPQAYDDVDPRAWPVAKRSLLAHLERIERQAPLPPKA